MNDAGRIGFVIRGNYDETETYDFLDVVYFNNCSYVARKLTIGNEPQESNEYWQMLANAVNNYTLPTASTTILGGVKSASSITSVNDGSGRVLAPCPIINGVPYYVGFDSFNQPITKSTLNRMLEINPDGNSAIIANYNDAYIFNENISCKDNIVIGNQNNHICSSASGETYYSQHNYIFGDFNNYINSDKNSNDSLHNDATTIIGGKYNEAYGASGVTILGGSNNTVHGISGVTILSGSNNTVTTGLYVPSSKPFPLLIGGNNNDIGIGYNKTYAAFETEHPIIMLGSNLCINTSKPVYTTTNSVIVLGTDNKPFDMSDAADNLLVVGKGNNTNALRLTTAGYLYYNTGCGAGADYSEFFEWADGNPNNEDRCGIFVTFDFDNNTDYTSLQELPRIRPAQSGEYVLGVISGNPSFVGNADEEWKKRWLYDEYDRPIMEEVQVPITNKEEIETGEYRTEIEYDENDNEVEVQVPVTQIVEVETGEYRTEIRQAVNPEYDEEKNYVSRFDRKEWETTGLLGVLSVRDDGTCVPGRFCRCGHDGIATIAEERTLDTFLVLRRVSDHIIKIMFK